MHESKIIDARVIVTCPGRNFTTLKITTSDGISGIGDGTLNGRGSQSPRIYRSTSFPA